LIAKKVPGKMLCLILLAVFLLAPPAASAAPGDPGQAAAQGQNGQDLLTIIIWAIAALSISEMIRNSIQGLFTRLSGMNEASFASKAVGAIAGVGALFGLASLGGATLGAGARAGASGGQSFGGQSSINLGGQPAPEGAGQGLATGTGQVGDTAGLSAAGRAGSNLGASIGGFARSVATGIAGGALTLATSAIPGGERLAEAGTRFFNNTVGLGIQHAGAAAGRFVGTHGHLLGQSLQARRLSGGTTGLKDAFQQVTGGASFSDAMKRSMKFSTLHAAHQRAGGLALEGMKADGEKAGGEQAPVTSMDGVRYTP
jgi:hypothetical protein